jgi:hypothetical protein
VQDPSARDIAESRSDTHLHPLLSLADAIEEVAHKALHEIPVRELELRLAIDNEHRQTVDGGPA